MDSHTVQKVHSVGKNLTDVAEFCKWYDWKNNCSGLSQYLSNKKRQSRLPSTIFLTKRPIYNNEKNMNTCNI
jgi:hypothetical protein